MTFNIQEKFNFVFDFLIEQGEPGYTHVPNRTSYCSYYNPENNTDCAVGALLPQSIIQEIVRDDFFGDVDDLLDVYGDVEEIFGTDYEVRKFLRALQWAHDTAGEEYHCTKHDITPEHNPDPDALRAHWYDLLVYSINESVILEPLLSVKLTNE